MIFGAENNKALILDGANFKIVKIGRDYSINDILKHDMYDKNLAMLLSEITYIPELPVPLGILYKENKPTYEEMMNDQMQQVIDSKGEGNIEKLIIGNNSWVVE